MGQFYLDSKTLLFLILIVSSLNAVRLACEFPSSIAVCRCGQSKDADLRREKHGKKCTSSSGNRRKHGREKWWCCRRTKKSPSFQLQIGFALQFSMHFNLMSLLLVLISGKRYLVLRQNSNIRNLLLLLFKQSSSCSHGRRQKQML